MLKNSMEDRRLDLDAPLLSVRRSGDGDRDKAPPALESRRSSLPFYKLDLKSGPVRNPGAVPFVWEQTPGRPKNGSEAGNSGGNGAVVAPKPPSGRIVKDKSPSEEQSASTLPPTRTGSSVRTRKTVTFAPDAGTVKPPPPLEDSSRRAVLEKEKEQQPIRKAREEAVTFGPDAGAAKPSLPAEDSFKKTTLVKEEKQQPIWKGDEEDLDDDAFSGAHDTLSRVESFFMNCSVSGLSGIPESAEPASGFSTDPQVREFMMGRFLPAAKAMASDSPHYTFRKAPAPSHDRAFERVNAEHRRPPISFQHKPYDVSRYVQQQQQQQQVARDVNRVDNDDDDDEDEEDYDDAFPSKGCGFLPNFCLKSSFLLLNPVPGVKVRGHLPAPPRREIRSLPVKSSLNGSTGQLDDESWEAVCRHKLGQGHYQHELEDDRSKLTSETKQLTNWSDSPTADGVSPLRHSTGGCVSPYREASQLPFHEGKGFLGVPSRESKSSKTDASDASEKDGESYWEITPHHSSHLDSGSISPALEKTLYVDSVDVPDTHDPDSSLVGMMSSCEKGSEVEIRNRRIKESSPVKACQADVLKPKVFNFVKPVYSEITNHTNIGSHRNSRENGGAKVQIPFDSGDGRKKLVDPLQPILPPPLPKSPSESWLSRTLPSVASNKPVPQSLLGIGYHRKQALQTPSTDTKKFQNAKPPKTQRRQIRFAEVLVKPESPKSEI